MKDGLHSYLRSAIVRRSLWNAAGQVVPPTVALLLTPFLIANLGLDRYGICALVLTIMTVAVSLDGGLGQSVGRFFGTYRATGNNEAAFRLFASAVLAGGAFAVAVSIALHLAAEPLANAAHIPSELIVDAAAALRWTGPLVGLAFLSNLPLAVLQAHDRFAALSGLTGLTSGVYGIAAAVLVLREPSVASVLQAVGLRLILSLVGGVALIWRHLERGSVLIDARTAREVGSYSARVQASSLLALVNGQVDALVIAALLPVRFVGLYAAGYQAAWTLRGIALWAMPPVATSLFTAYGEGGAAEARRRFLRLNAAWQQTVTVGFAIVAAGVGFLVPGWLGPGHSTAAWVAALLALGYAVNLTTAVATNYVRAVGRPGIETRYAMASVGLNLVLTIPAGITFGLYGILGATVAGTVVGTLLFPVFGSRASMSELWQMLERVPRVRTAAYVTAVLGVETAIAASGLQGRVRLVAAAVPIVLLAMHALSGSSVRVFAPTHEPVSGVGDDAALPGRP